MFTDHPGDGMRRGKRVQNACVNVVSIASGTPIPRGLLLLRVPQVDVQALDLLDQHENRFSGCPEIVAATGSKTHAPSAELIDLALVQTIGQRFPKWPKGQCTTACNDGGRFSRHRLRFRRWVSQTPSPNLLVGDIEEPPQKCNQGRLFD